MTVKEKYNVESAALLFNLVNGSPEKLSECDEIITARAYCIYEDEKGKEILSMIIDTGEIFATNSDTFIKGFRNYYTFCDEFDVPYNERKVRVVHGKSKSGRDFIQCAAVE